MLPGLWKLGARPLSGWRLACQPKYFSQWPTDPVHVQQLVAASLSSCNYIPQMASFQCGKSVWTVVVYHWGMNINIPYPENGSHLTVINYDHSLLVLTQRQICCNLVWSFCGHIAAYQKDLTTVMKSKFTVMFSDSDSEDKQQAVNKEIRYIFVIDNRLSISKQCLQIQLCWV